MKYHVYALKQDGLLRELDRAATLEDAMECLRDVADSDMTAWVMFQGRCVATCRDGQLVEVES